MQEPNVDFNTTKGSQLSKSLNTTNLMSRIRYWEQIGLLATIFFFWIIGNEELIRLKRIQAHEWINLAFTVIVVYLVWGIFRLLIRYLLPWRAKWSTSFYYIVQIILSSTLLLTIIYWMNYVYIYHFWQGSFEENYFREVVFPLAIVTTGLWNLIDFGYHLYLDKEKAEAQLKQPAQQASTTTTTLKVYQGRNLVQLTFDEIAFFRLKNQLIEVVTFEGTHFHLDQSLSKLEDTIDPQTFYRINRQMLISRNAVRKVLREKNQKLSIELMSINSTQETSSVSRYKAAHFLKWWRQAENA